MGRLHMKLLYVKRENRIPLCLVLLFWMLLMVFPSRAADRNVRISSVKITVSDYLKELTLEDSSGQFPSISESDFSAPDSEQYEIESAEWQDTAGGMTVGGQPKVLLYLSAQEKERSGGYSTFYYFNGTYDSTNVRVNGGTFVSAQTVGNYGLKVVLSLKSIKGSYSAPQNLAWGSTLGMATWNPSSMSSGYYKVTLYRDGSKVTTITTDQTNLPLYPYMTKAGGYYFEVSCIPYGTSQNVGTASEAVQSSTLNISASQISQGGQKYADNTYILNQTKSSSAASGTTSGSTGLTNYNSGTAYTVYNPSTGKTSTLPGVSIDNGTGTAASGSSGTVYSVYGDTTSGTTASQGSLSGNWYKTGNDWYFRTLSGTNMANTWLLWQDHYYRFDGNGRMVTGFYTDSNGGTYYLSASGAMKTSWAVINGAWYYFNPSAGSNYGWMYTNQLVTIGNKNYYFDKDGRMRTGWVILKDASNQDQYYYFYPQTSQSDNNYGQMAMGTTVLGGYTLAADGHWVH